MSKSIRARYAALHNQFGTAGLALSVVAIVLALGGGAYAANHATASKAKAGKRGPKGPPGAPGATGPAGPAGAAGAAGPAGPAGTGTAGTPGTSATTASFNGAKAPCTVGGVEVKSASPTALVCNGKQGEQGEPGENGEEGSPWTAGGTLPKGATETGVFSMRLEGAGGGNVSATAHAQSPISFPIQLPEPLAGGKDVAWFYVHTSQQSGGQPEQCPGTVEEPKAAEGALCLYQGSTRYGGGEEGEIYVASVLRPGPFGLEEEQEGAGKTGTVINLKYEQGEGGAGAKRVEYYGSWAVTAE